MNVISGLVRVGIAGIIGAAVVVTSPVWGSYLAYVKVADKLSEWKFNREFAENKTQMLPKLQALFADNRAKIKDKDIQVLHDCAVDKVAQLGAMAKAAKNYNISSYRHSVSFERGFEGRDTPKESNTSGFGEEFKRTFHDCTKPLAASRYTPEDIHVLISAYTKAAEVYSGREYTLDRPEIFAEDNKNIAAAIAEMEVDKDSFQPSLKNSPFLQILNTTRAYSKDYRSSMFGYCVASAAQDAYIAAEKDYKFSGGPFWYDYQPYNREGRASDEQVRKDQAYATRYTKVFNEALAPLVSKCEMRELKGYDSSRDYGRVPEGIKAYALSFAAADTMSDTGKLGYYKPTLAAAAGPVWLSGYVRSENSRLFEIERTEKDRADAAEYDRKRQAAQEKAKLDTVAQASCGQIVLVPMGRSYCINSITGERTYKPYTSSFSITSTAFTAASA
jgi:hypothetical protein